MIGNLLSTRKKSVTFITRDTERVIELSDQEEAEGMEIESKIVPELIHLHSLSIESYQFARDTEAKLTGKAGTLDL